MKYIARNFLLGLFGLILMAGSCEKEGEVVNNDPNPYHSIVFYNVENLFDTLDQPGTFDEEFMPDTDKQWNSFKLYDKLDKIARVVTDIDAQNLPGLIGLCEIENREVLEMLLATTSLSEQGNYQIVHKESPDFRGIDVALLYREDIFELLDYRLWPVWFPFQTNYSTREVLYVKGNLSDKGLLHIFVNHWPSRSGGEIESRPKRIFVAEMVRQKVDSIFETDGASNIIIMGDLNDEPNDLSVVSGLSAHTSFDEIQTNDLYALSMNLVRESSIGSYKYRGNWNMLDQFVVSGNLMDSTADLYCRPADVEIISHSYLFEEDKTYMGKKPFRTYLGDYFHGGYSDHLPVRLKIHYRE